VHSIPTTAFRVACAGRSIGFSADSAFDPALIDWLAPCDLIVHEATTAPESPVHTPLARLAELPEPIRRRLRLIHYPDDLDGTSCPIERLDQGRCYAV
jgi:ribonuclease BN (tRNA processing enzyme)